MVYENQVASCAFLVIACKHTFYLRRNNDEQWKKSFHMLHHDYRITLFPKKKKKDPSSLNSSSTQKSSYTVRFRSTVMHSGPMFKVQAMIK